MTSKNLWHSIRDILFQLLTLPFQFLIFTLIMMVLPFFLLFEILRNRKRSHLISHYMVPGKKVYLQLGTQQIERQILYENFINKIQSKVVIFDPLSATELELNEMKILFGNVNRANMFFVTKPLNKIKFHLALKKAKAGNFLKLNHLADKINLLQ